MKLTKEVVETFEYIPEPEAVEEMVEKYPSLLSFELFGRTWELRPFALCVVIAAVCALALLWMTARRSGLKNKETPATLGLLLLPLGLVFARAFYVLASWTWFEEIGLQHTLYLWEGGYAMWGAIIGCTLAVLLTSRISKERPSVLFDACAAPMALFIALCRFAAYPFSGESRGYLIEETSFFCRLPFAVQENGEWYWAVFILEGIVALIIMAVLLSGRRKNGEKAVLFLILYSASQIYCEGLHGTAGKMVWHQFVRISQLVCAVVLAVLFIAGVIRRNRSSASCRLPGIRIAELAVALIHGLALVIAMEFARDKPLLLSVPVCCIIIADAGFLIGYAIRSFLNHPSAGRTAEMSVLLLLGAAIAAGGIINMGKPLSLPVGLCYILMAAGCVIAGYAVYRAALDPARFGTKGA